MDELSNQQTVQESRYEYPYHYIPVLGEKYFMQTQTLSWGYEYLSYLLFVLGKAQETDFKSLLDVGCGDGRFLFELQRRAEGKRLVGIDYSKRAIDYAKIMSQDIEWVYGRIENREIFKEKFDLVTLIETLEHIPPGNVSSFLQAIHFHLEEAGRLIITVPSTNVPLTKKHYQHFDTCSLTACLQPFFEVVDIYYLNRQSALSLKIIRKLLSNRFMTLTNAKLLRRIYDFYVANLFISDVSNCGRIAVICKKCGSQAFKLDIIKTCVK